MQLSEPAPLRFDLPAGPRLRLVGRGPALFAQDKRVLDAFAAAAQAEHETARLSDERGPRTLGQVDRQRTALLAAVGHDLRTPLAAIKAASSSLRQSEVDWSDAQRDELLATIDESADRLDSVVSNLLDASRLQAGQLTVRAAPVALDEIVGMALLSVPEAAGRVEVDVPEDLPLVMADPGLLERVLANVIDNAVRHGRGESVRITAEATSTAARVAVVDHGPGVPAAEREDLFAPFQQLGDRRAPTAWGSDSRSHAASPRQWAARSWPTAPTGPA